MIRVKQVYVEGFEIGQIWEQARRILDASRQEVERYLPGILPSSEDEVSSADVRQDDIHEASETSSPDDDQDEYSSTEEEDEDDEDEDDENDEVEEKREEGSIENFDKVLSKGKDVNDGVIDEDESDIVPGAEKELQRDNRPSESFVPDKYGLNDGFFSIDEFNKHSGFLEQQDARRERNNEDNSDEEEIDWATDPLSTRSSHNVLQSSTKTHEEQESEAEDGPTFSDADGNASESDEETPMDDMGIMNNTNDIKYEDFFEPPPRRASQSKRNRALPKTQPPAPAAHQPDEDDIQKTIAAVRRDIFEDDLSASDEPPPPSDSDPTGPSSRSNHQKRQAKIIAEIRQLEAANVAKRDWTLSGEARAADRPINSLLEEDLDFERAGKPIPVITNEVSEDIEALIKRRILARDFDEVIRRRPGNLVTGDQTPSLRRGRFELDDSKPQQSLAEVYESEHLQRIDPDGYVDAKDSKLKAQQDAIEALWNDVSAKLDALASLHFKPKPPTATIKVVTDVPAITIEDARPSAGADVAGASMLAPQEIYKVGEGRLREEKMREVVSKGGAVVGRDEMSREQKLRRRRREKERIRKTEGPPQVDGRSRVDGRNGKKAREEKEIRGRLKRGGVRVIGKKGELRNVEGRTVVGVGAGDGKAKAAGAYKL